MTRQVAHRFLYAEYDGITFRESRPGSGLKWCTRCRRELHPLKFYQRYHKPNGRFYLSPYCKDCMNQLSNHQYRKHKEASA